MSYGRIRDQGRVTAREIVAVSCAPPAPIDDAVHHDLASSQERDYFSYVVPDAMDKLDANTRPRRERGAHAHSMDGRLQTSVGSSQTRGDCQNACGIVAEEGRDCLYH